jgi:hypothetical protein
MPLFYFKLVDTNFVSNYGAHELPNETAAQITALDIVKSLRETRPELIGNHYSLSVTDEFGDGVCMIPLDIIL